MKKLIIWDFDGVIADSEKLWVSVWLETLEKEILTLICHGILHLFGFDHLTKKDYDFVVNIQNQVMEKL